MIEISKSIYKRHPKTCEVWQNLFSLRCLSFCIRAYIFKKKKPAASSAVRCSGFESSSWKPEIVQSSGYKASWADNCNNTLPKLAALSDCRCRGGNRVLLFFPCSPSAVSPSTCQMAPRKAAVTAGSETTSPPVGPARPTRCPWASPRTSSTSRRLPTAAPRATATPTPSPVSAQLCSSHSFSPCRNQKWGFFCFLQVIVKGESCYSAAEEAFCF